MIFHSIRRLSKSPRFNQQRRNLRVIRIGRGPSSSHTDATETAARLAIEKRYLDDHIAKINIEFSGSARLEIPFGTGVGHGVRWGAFNGIMKGINPQLSDNAIQHRYDHWSTLDASSANSYINEGDFNFRLTMGDACSDLRRTKFDVGGFIDVTYKSGSTVTNLWDSVGSGYLLYNGQSVDLPGIDAGSLSSYVGDDLDSMSCTSCANCHGVSRSINSTWFPGQHHPFFDAIDLLRSATPKTKSERRLNAVWLATMMGMRLNDMGQKTPIFPTKGSSGVAYAARALAVFYDHPYMHVLNFCDAYFELYLEAGASTAASKEGCMAETGPAAAGLAYALTKLRRGSDEHAFEAARLMHVMIMGLSCLPDDGAVRSPCTERDALFSLVADAVSTYVIDNDLTCSKESLVMTIMDGAQVGRSMPVSIKETMGMAELSKHVDVIPLQRFGIFFWHPDHIAAIAHLNYQMVPQEIYYAFVQKILAFHNPNQDNRVYLAKESLPRIMRDTFIEGMTYFLRLMTMDYLNRYYDVSVTEKATSQLQI
ncbi:MAG: L-serine ammonia-lyase, iron-sulfur-dependent, subunit alpha [Candidatus Marinamargulisbacteria bacterium]